MANGTWKIARGKGSAQLPLAIVAILAIGLVLVGKAQTSLFDRARTYFSDWTSPVLETVRGPVKTVSGWTGGVFDYFNVYQENQRLKEENARLRQWQNAALVLEQRLKRYQLLLNAVPDPSLGAVTAHVIGRANRPFLNTMILDAGKAQSVKPGEAVVDARGMIGRIFLAGDHTSWVIQLTDLNSRIPVSIEPGNIQALMTGDNTSAPTLETLGQGVELKEGQQIITSGDGGLLPSGIQIGTVVADGYSFRAALLADPATSDDVRILNLKSPPEQPPVASANDLPVTAAGLAPLAPPAAPITAVPQAPAANGQKPAVAGQKPGVTGQKPATAQTPAQQQPPPDNGNE
jgi:rod shape-determining protein MreC